MARDTVTVSVIDVRCGDKKDKVFVCHKDKMICISPNAVPAHLAHGDKLGNCFASSSLNPNDLQWNSSFIQTIRTRSIL